MAQRFVEQATNEIGPVYSQQIDQLNSQIPAIQQLYQTLTQGLQQQTNQQIDTGVRDITEDASRRGVLRSTLPVDARQSLLTTLSQALAEGTGKLNLQQAQEVGNIKSQVGQLGIQRASAIQSLADTLYGRDMKERQFQMEQQQAAQAMALARSKGGGGGSGRAPTQAETVSSAASSLFADLKKNNLVGRDGYVSPQTYAEYRRAWGAAGFTDFDKYFAGLKNPQNKSYKYY